MQRFERYDSLQLCRRLTGALAPSFGGNGLKLWPREGNWTAQQGRVEPMWFLQGTQMWQQVTGTRSGQEPVCNMGGSRERLCRGPLRGRVGRGARALSCTELAFLGAQCPARDLTTHVCHCTSSCIAILQEEQISSTDQPSGQACFGVSEAHPITMSVI